MNVKQTAIDSCGSLTSRLPSSFQAVLKVQIVKMVLPTDTILKYKLRDLR